MAQFQELNEDQWALIQELMSWSPPKERGKPRTNLKRVWNAILYILTHGCRWEDLPKDAKYAHRATAHRWLMFWQKAGVFDRVLTGLLKKAATEGKMIGIASLGTVLFPPAPGGGTQVTHGYKGKGSLLHLLVDAKGSCLAMTSTGANGNEREKLLELIERVKGLTGKREMIVVEADKGYDSAELRQELLSRGFFPLIPWRKNVKGAPAIREVASQFGLKPIRWVVERTHSWLKRKYRRLMARWERKSEIWDAMAQLALIMEWVKNLLR